MNAPTLTNRCPLPHPSACRARGWDFDLVGVARVPLRQVLEDVSIGSGEGGRVARVPLRQVLEDVSIGSGERGLSEYNGGEAVTCLEDARSRLLPLTTDPSLPSLPQLWATTYPGTTPTCSAPTAAASAACGTASASASRWTRWSSSTRSGSAPSAPRSRTPQTPPSSLWRR